MVNRKYLIVMNIKVIFEMVNLMAKEYSLCRTEKDMKEVLKTEKKKTLKVKASIFGQMDHILKETGKIIFKTDLGF